MSDHKITFFPVGNGDTFFINLKDDTNILIDCNFTKDADDEEVKERYDVKSYLLDHLPSKDGITHLSAFILTHPDIDHCRGFSKHFHMDNPDEYKEKDKNQEKIIIDELWFSPRIFTEYDKELNEDAKQFKKEANRRIELFKNDQTIANKKGNRIRIIGYSDNDELEGLESITTAPGQFINLINGNIKDDFSFFVLGPVKKDTDDQDGARNEASIVLKANFSVSGLEDAGIVVLGGDAGCYNWKRILDKNEVESLAFDIFVAPHHCSWYFFNEERFEDNSEPEERIIDMLNGKREGAIVVASCKPIEDNDDNPPHFHAAELYTDIFGEDKFVCTSEYPSVDEPKPLIFTFTENGPVEEEPGEDRCKASMILKKTINKPATYGSNDNGK